MSGQSDIEKVREATDLVQLIGEHIALKPRGREYVGLCPFHDDHKPSFAVVTHKGNAFYKCHSCGAAGDAFTFVQEYHKLDFPEALRFMADRAGITLTDRREASASTGGPSRSDLRKATAFATDFYRSMLNDPTFGADAGAVIERRGISPEMVERFQLGLAIDQWDALFGRLRQKTSAIKTALAAGLIKQRNTGDGCYDTFRNRLIFPICDESGAPIALGGRIIDPEDTPKYLNSPESAIFNKSKTLYGLHLAKRTIIETGQAIVTEGYTDVIACHQAGIENVVGTMGTSLTREHAMLLSRLCDTVVLVFDGDEAGARAANRAIQVFFSAPVDIRICTLPDNLDPDELLAQADGAERFRDVIARSIDVLTFKIGRFREELAGVDSLSGKQKRVEQLLEELSELGFDTMQGVRKPLVMTQLADLLGVSPSDLEQSMPKRRPRGGAMPKPETGREAMTESMTWTESTPLTSVSGPPLTRARRLAERELLALLVYDLDAGRTCRIKDDEDRDRPLSALLRIEHFADEPSRRIAQAVLPRLASDGPCTMQALLGALTDDSDRQLISALYFEAQSRCGDDELATMTQIGCAARTLLEQNHRVRLQSLSPPSSSTRESDGAAEQLRQFIQQRREEGHRPDAIFLGARSSERKS